MPEQPTAGHSVVPVGDTRALGIGNNAGSFLLPSRSSKIPLWFETSPFRGKREVDKTAEPMKSFSVTPPFREGQSARPLSVGCGVSRRMGPTVD